MIEFDVLPVDMDDRERTPLVLAHDYTHALEARPRSRGPGAPRRGVAGVELDVDLKLPGYEARVVEALRAHGLVERALISSQYMRSLVALRALEPGLRLGWSVPRVQARLHANRLYAAPAYALLSTCGGSCPGTPPAHLARAAATR